MIIFDIINLLETKEKDEKLLLWFISNYVLFDLFYSKLQIKSIIQLSNLSISIIYRRVQWFDRTKSIFDSLITVVEILHLSEVQADLKHSFITLNCKKA